MEIVKTVKDLRWALRGRSWKRRTGLVPTMGALHAGHLSLVKFAQAHAAKVAATIFVNPTQFAPGEDLDSYPRTLETDLEALEKAGCDAVFVPSVQTMYPPGEVTRVAVPGPVSETLEGEHRPHFFGGVATVVTKLLASAQADVAVFGEKDFQQLQVIRRLAADLLLNTEIKGAPTIRAKDGLALSSRNAYLSDEERAIAPALHEALQTAKLSILSGTPAQEASKAAIKTIQDKGFGQVDYLAYRRADDLSIPKEHLKEDEGRLLVAAWLGKTRLIDNISA